VELRNGDYSPTGYEAKLTKATPDYKNSRTILEFDQPLPDTIHTDAILFNHRYPSTDIIIRNCTFHENRARAILCNTANWLIEGNKFFHNQFSAVHVDADLTPWDEGFGARNVIIRNNTFSNVNPLGAHDGSVIYVSADIGGTPTAYPLLQDILIENNTFTETPGPVMEAASFHNLIFRNNRIVNSNRPSVVEPFRGSIRAELGDHLVLDNNVWTTLNGLVSPELVFDADTAKDIVCSNNRLNR
jgi:hypothetical protein